MGATSFIMRNPFLELEPSHVGSRHPFFFWGGGCCQSGCFVLLPVPISVMVVVVVGGGDPFWGCLKKELVPEPTGGSPPASCAPPLTPGTSRTPPAEPLGGSPRCSPPPPSSPNTLCWCQSHPRRSFPAALIPGDPEGESFFGVRRPWGLLRRMSGGVAFVAAAPRARGGGGGGLTGRHRIGNHVAGQLAALAVGRWGGEWWC